MHIGGGVSHRAAPHSEKEKMSDTYGGITRSKISIKSSEDTTGTTLTREMLQASFDSLKSCEELGKPHNYHPYIEYDVWLALDADRKPLGRYEYFYDNPLTKYRALGTLTHDFNICGCGAKEPPRTHGEG